MNLVAKEYVAAQDHDDPGVLVLSRFAGAAAEYTSALLVNPYDPEAVAMTIMRALSMPLDERRERHIALFQTTAENNIRTWAAQFLGTLAGGHDEPIWQAPFLGREMNPSVGMA